MEQRMTAKYIFDSLLTNYDNEVVIKKYSWLRNKAIIGAINQGRPNVRTELYIDLEEAVKAEQIDDVGFELIYYYLKFLSGRFLFVVDPNWDYEYVITFTFCCYINSKQLAMVIKTIEEVLDILLPDYSKYIKVGTEICEPFSHTFRKTNLKVKTANERLTSDEELKVIKIVVGDLSTLSVAPNDKDDNFRYVYIFRSFGMKVLTLCSKDEDLYKNTMNMAPKDYEVYKNCTVRKYDDCLWAFIAIIIRQMIAEESCKDIEELSKIYEKNTLC